MDGCCGTYRHAFTTKLTFIRIDKGQVIFHCNSIILAYLEAFGAPYTGHAAILFRHGTFFRIDAGDKYFAVLLHLFTKLDDVPGAGFHAGSAGSAFIINHHRQLGSRVHVDGIKSQTTTQSPQPRQPLGHPLSPI